jgi:hypothetical protein
MPRVITLTGLHQMGADLPVPEPVGGSCASRYAKEIVIDGKTYCQSIETGKIYDPATGDEIEPAAKGGRLLNYGIAMGAGALVGIFAVAMSSKKKKGAMLAVGAGTGAAVGAVLLAMTWPKAAPPQA